MSPVDVSYCDGCGGGHLCLSSLSVLQLSSKIAIKRIVTLTQPSPSRERGICSVRDTIINLQAIPEAVLTRLAFWMRAQVSREGNGRG